MSKAEADRLIGLKITAIRDMTKQEQATEGWLHPATVIELENDIKLYASSNDEGDTPGSMFGDDQGYAFIL